MYASNKEYRQGWLARICTSSDRKMWDENHVEKWQMLTQGICSTMGSTTGHDGMQPQLTTQSIDTNQLLVGYERALSVLHDGLLAEEVVIQAAAGFETTASCQIERRRKTPTGERPSYRFVLSDQQLFDFLVLHQLELKELEQERCGMRLSHADLISRFAKFPIKIALNHNSFYAAAGLCIGLSNYPAKTLLRLYEAAAPDRGQRKGDREVSRARYTLHTLLAERFRNVAQMEANERVRQNRQGERLRFVKPEPAQILVMKQTLSCFVPLQTLHCIAEHYHNNGPHTPLSLSEDDDLAEIQRIHCFFCPICFDRLTKGCKTECFEILAQIPILKEGQNSSDAIGDVHGFNMEKLQVKIREERDKRRRVAPGSLRIRIDNIEKCIVSKASHPQTVPLGHHVGVVELVGRANGEDVVVATHVLTYDGSSKTEIVHMLMPWSNDARVCCTFEFDAEDAISASFFYETDGATTLASCSQPIRVFLSYNFKDEEFAAVIAHLLRKQPGIEPFLYANEKRAEAWPELLIEGLRNCAAFVYLAGKAEGETQSLEASWHFANRKTTGQKTLMVCLPECEIPERYSLQGVFDPIYADTKSARNDAREYVAREIALHLCGSWIPTDGVPLGYLFDYEKDIIEEYVKKRLRPENCLAPQFLEKGCPTDWPKVTKREASRENDPKIQEKIGTFRADDSAVAVDTRISDLDGCVTHEANQIRLALTFPEAGPRKRHLYPSEGQRHLSAGILVSGGIAPGINAVIDGIVKRHEAYLSLTKEMSNQTAYHLRIFGYRQGLQSLMSDGMSPLELTSEHVARQAEMGGSLLATSRWDKFVHANALERDKLLTRIVFQLTHKPIDILYVIGGDGSMRAAHAIWKKAQELGEPLSVIGIPKTMDNDILWVWQSFGFLSAAEKAREAVLNLHTEARSNPRLCILQLFGSDSGFVAAHAGLSSGVADAVLIPEVDYTMEGLFSHIQKRLTDRYFTSPHALVIMGETAIPMDARAYIAGQGPQDPALENLRVNLSGEEISAIMRFFEQNRRVLGQTPDHLRTGGLKIVAGVLEAMIKQRMQPQKYWREFRVFTSEPRHLIRSVPPTSSEVIFAERLGALAVDSAMAGYTDCIVSQWLTEFVLVPLELVILGRKRVPPDGIFWKSVLLSTGQPEDMYTKSGLPGRASR